MNLAIDIGNSFTKIGLFNKGRLYKVNTYRTFSNDISFTFPVIPRNAGISSVVPEQTDLYVDLCLKKFNLKPLIINNKINLPIKLKVRKSYTLGSDRICNSVFGYEYYKRKENVIIISFGTAVTYDVILRNGDYIGGMISPGPDISAKALHLFTGQLPIVNTKDSQGNLLVGYDTVSAIKSGILNSVLFTASQFVKSSQKNYRRKFRVIVTGGYSDLFINKLDFKHHYEKYSVLKGINYIISYNQ
ncbi:MAG: type III pantothenate kinase [Ignavibacteria bacterium]|nr:type III pantothenate kinase [Ignavibacteria bacterium]